MLPMVLKALSRPTTSPLFSTFSTVYRAREGVTVPNKNKGKTKMSMQEINAAITKKLVLMVTTNSPEIAKIKYFPNTGIAAIHSAAMRIRV